MTFGNYVINTTSIPLAVTITNNGTTAMTLGTRTITVPIANHDNNQHSFNENVRIQNLWDGIELMAALLTM